MKPEKFPILELAFKGELVSNNVNEFGLAVHSWLDSLPSDPQTDEEFGAAEEAVKTIKQAEDEIRAKVDSIYPADIKTLRDCLGDLLNSMAKKRLALNKAVVGAKEAKKEALLDSAIEKLPIDESFQRSHYRGILSACIKGKRSIVAIEKELGLQVKIICAALEKALGMLSQFTGEYGEASLPDRPQLLIKDPAALEPELRRRADLIEAQKREEALKAEAAKAKAELDAASKPAEETPAEETPPAPQPELIPEEKPEAPVNHLAEWREFAEVVRSTAMQMREARSRLRDPRNIEKAGSFAAALSAAWKEVA